MKFKICTLVTASSMLFLSCSNDTMENDTAPIEKVSISQLKNSPLNNVKSSKLSFDTLDQDDKKLITDFYEAYENDPNSVLARNIFNFLKFKGINPLNSNDNTVKKYLKELNKKGIFPTFTY